MPFISTLPPGCPIIGDHANATDADALMISGAPLGYRSKGREARNWDREPFGAHRLAKPFPDNFKIPRGDWPELIAYKQAQKSNLSDLILRSAPYVPSLNQSSTNFCWGNAVITALETLREANNQPYVKLSAASVCAPIKSYRNLGGWGGEALAYIVEHGVAPVEFWPPNAIDRQYDNEASRAARDRFKITEFWEIDSGDFDALASLLLRPDGAAAIGLNWWSHEVCALALVALAASKFGVLCRNSWSDDYGDGHGLFVLTESKATPDDCCSPAVTHATPSARVPGTPRTAA